MIDVIANASGTVLIGRLGENEHTRVLFDITDYLTMYPGATCELLFRPPGENLAYIVPQVSSDEHYLYWPVSNADLSKAGIGYCELVARLDETIVKSTLFVTKTLSALDDSGSVPSPWESWLTRFETIADEAAASAESAAQSAEFAAEHAYRITMSDTTLIFTREDE